MSSGHPVAHYLARLDNDDRHALGFAFLDHRVEVPCGRSSARGTSKKRSPLGLPLLFLGRARCESYGTAKLTRKSREDVDFRRAIANACSSECSTRAAVDERSPRSGPAGTERAGNSRRASAREFAALLSHGSRESRRARGEVQYDETRARVSSARLLVVRNILSSARAQADVEEIPGRRCVVAERGLDDPGKACCFAQVLHQLEPRRRRAKH